MTMTSDSDGDGELKTTADDPDTDCGRCDGSGSVPFGVPPDDTPVPCPSCMAANDCGTCGGTGEVVEMVMGRSGMVPCPSCRGDDRLSASITADDGGTDDAPGGDDGV